LATVFNCSRIKSSFGGSSSNRLFDCKNLLLSITVFQSGLQLVHSCVQLVNQRVRSGRGGGGGGSRGGGGSNLSPFDIQIEIVVNAITPGWVSAVLNSAILGFICGTGSPTVSNPIFDCFAEAIVVAQFFALKDRF
jgi:hypothetical protein